MNPVTLAILHTPISITESLKKTFHSPRLCSVYQLNVPLGDIFLTTPSPALASSTMVWALVPPIPNELTPGVLRHVLGKLELGELVSKRFRKMRAMKCWLLCGQLFIIVIIIHQPKLMPPLFGPPAFHPNCHFWKLPFLTLETQGIHFGHGPLPVIKTFRLITVLLGNPYNLKHLHLPPIFSWGHTEGIIP